MSPAARDYVALILTSSDLAGEESGHLMIFDQPEGQDLTGPFL